MADEVMNLDIYFAKMIAEKLREFKAQEAGCPGHFKDQASWYAKLDSIIVPLEVYTGRFDYTWTQELAATEAAKQAIKDLADILPMLWI